MGYDFILERVKAMCNSIDIISFDVFDTLLFRPYIKPTDLFFHLENIYKKPGFALARIRAEECARFMLKDTAPPPSLYRRHKS